MIIPSQQFKKPSWNRILWRYMDLAKFLDLITSESLYFTNCGKLTDKYEGELPVSTIEQTKKRFMDKLGLPEEEAAERAWKTAANVSEYKNFSLVNCWSAQKNESYALWKIYLGQSSHGVAIRTNVKNLEQSLSNSTQNIIMSEVSYTDHIDEFANIANVLMRKSPFYSYEKELRLLITSQMFQSEEQKEFNKQTNIVRSPETIRNLFSPKYPNGLKIPIDIDTLVDKIYLSPFAGDWFHDMLVEILLKTKPELVDKIVLSNISDS